MSYSPYMNLEELAVLLGYSNVRNLKYALKAGVFIFPTFQLAGKTVVSTAVVRKYFDDKAAEGILAMELAEEAPK